MSYLSIPKMGGLLPNALRFRVAFLRGRTKKKLLRISKKLLLLGYGPKTKKQ